MAETGGFITDIPLPNFDFNNPGDINDVDVGIDEDHIAYMSTVDQTGNTLPINLQPPVHRPTRNVRPQGLTPSGFNTSSHNFKQSPGFPPKVNIPSP